MLTWLKIIVYPTLVLFCAFLGGIIGIWTAVYKTQNETGAAGAADDVGEFLFGSIGFVIGLMVGVVLLLILMARLKRRTPAAAAPPPEENVWPPAPRSDTRG